MAVDFLFSKKRIWLGIIFFLILNIVSIWFIINPEIFIRNFLMKKWHIQVLGFLGVIYTLMMLYSFVILIFRKQKAFIISECFLIDNTKFESIGKIYFSEIDKIKRLKKYSLEIVLKEPILQSKKLNFLQKILHITNNWNYKNTIIVSSALLNCDVDVLESSIISAMNKCKSKYPSRPRL